MKKLFLMTAATILMSSCSYTISRQHTRDLKNRVFTLIEKIGDDKDQFSENRTILEAELLTTQDALTSKGLSIEDRDSLKAMEGALSWALYDNKEGLLYVDYYIEQHAKNNPLGDDLKFVVNDRGLPRIVELNSIN